MFDEGIAGARLREVFCTVQQCQQRRFFILT
jgi:hypothetical protein